MSIPGATLYIFSGLPGTGKTTLARMLAHRLNAAYIRIDTIEQAIRDLCHIQVEAEGYRMAYRIAGDNLKAGLSVVADSCNPISLTRNEWEDVARVARANWINVEILCSDTCEHRNRVESRTSDIPGHTPPSWRQVEDREYHPWDRPRVVIDTFGKTPQESAQELTAAISKHSRTAL